MASTTFLLAITAPSGAYPEERPLAVTRMSAATEQCSTAKFRPVRPMPVITSSAINNAPRRRQISATACKYPGGGVAAPSVAPLMGSKMKPAAALQFRGVLLSAVVATVGAVKRAAIAVRHADVLE